MEKGKVIRLALFAILGDGKTRVVHAMMEHNTKGDISSKDHTRGKPNDPLTVLGLSEMMHCPLTEIPWWKLAITASVLNTGASYLPPWEILEERRKRRMCVSKTSIWAWNQKGRRKKIKKPDTLSKPSLHEVERQKSNRGKGTETWAISNTKRQLQCTCLLPLNLQGLGNSNMEER